MITYLLAYIKLIKAYKGYKFYVESGGEIPLTFKEFRHLSTERINISYMIYLHKYKNINPFRKH